MDQKQIITNLEKASSKLEKVKSFNQIVYEFITKEPKEGVTSESALTQLLHNREYYAELLDQMMELLEDSSDSIEEVIYSLEEKNEIDSSVN